MGLPASSLALYAGEAGVRRGRKLSDLLLDGRQLDTGREGPSPRPSEAGWEVGCRESRGGPWDGGGGRGSEVVDGGSVTRYGCATCAQGRRSIPRT